ncbi:MFS transporter [Streptomyces noursei]|uniref:MFS transporter n=1 Tax=Streptomyces noursei TaxID=1971 RepID=UPI00099BE55F|nr:MFS transporter [Streptomyces noursei]
MADLAPQSVPHEPPVPPGGTRAALRAAARWRRQIFAVTWLAYAGFYFVRQAFAVAKLGILDDPTLHGVLTERVLGVLDAVYLAAYAVGQFLWGMWADRFGPRVVVTVGMLGAIAAACTMGVSSALVVFGGALVVQGLSQSAGWAPLCKNMGNFFPVHTRGRVLGLWSTNYAFGGLAAPPFLAWWAYQLLDSWHAAFLVGAATLAVVLVVFLLFQRDAPPDSPAGNAPPDAAPTASKATASKAAASTAAASTSAPPAAARRAPFAPYRAALRDRMVLTLGAAYFLLKPARYAILLWGPVLVSERLPAVGKVGATVIPISFGAAGVLAPMLIGWLSDTVFRSRRVPPCVLALAVLTGALALFMPLTATGSAVVMMAVLAVIGLAVYAADAMISCVAAVDFGAAGGAGTAAGLVNGCGSIGAVLGGLLPGFLSGTALFHGFAGAALVAGLLLLPHWNRRPATRSS